jgi:hypothetical protein
MCSYIRLKVFVTIFNTKVLKNWDIKLVATYSYIRFDSHQQASRLAAVGPFGPYS